MTVAFEVRKIVFLGNGSTGPFTFNFRILHESHIIVTHIDDEGTRTVYENPDDYTIELVSLGLEGGSITLDTALAIGERLVVEGNTPLTQLADYTNQGAFSPETHENSYDKLTLIAQEIKALFDRAVKIPSADENITVELPVAEVRALKYLSFDEDGNIVATGAAQSAAAEAAAAEASANAAAASAELAANAPVVSSDATGITISSATHKGAYLRTTAGSAVTITLPNDTNDTDMTVNSEGYVFQAGAGQVQFVADSGVTINAAPGAYIAQQYSGAAWKKVAANTYDVFGALTS